jgi:hypothetical protein
LVASHGPELPWFNEVDIATLEKPNILILPWLTGRQWQRTAGLDNPNVYHDGHLYYKVFF